MCKSLVKNHGFLLKKLVFRNECFRLQNLICERKAIALCCKSQRLLLFLQRYQEINSIETRHSNWHQTNCAALVNLVNLTDEFRVISRRISCTRYGALTAFHLFELTVYQSRLKQVREWLSRLFSCDRSAEMRKRRQKNISLWHTHLKLQQKETSPEKLPRG